MDLAPLVPVDQRFPGNPLREIENAVRAELARAFPASSLPAQARISIGVGSRGIANLARIVRATVAHFRDAGLRPCVIPAMGSHGGGTAAGQRKVLADYGITEAAIGCPVESQLDVVPIGSTTAGIPACMDRLAWESDGVFLINRVKWHTTFDAPIESGLVKMAATGLGKLQGAADYHRHAVRMGFGRVIEEVGRHVLASGKVLGGLAIVEDAQHQISEVKALRAPEIPAEEARLLERVKRTMPRLAFDEVDILIVDEIGKHISGVGMDSKVINRHPYGAANPWPWAPRILRIYARTLSPLSHGNANGVGMADVISEDLYAAIDWQITRVNALTANNLHSIRIPLRAASDREALEILSGVVGRTDPREVTCVWIRNTLELTRIVVTENLLGCARTDLRVEPAGEPQPWAFDPRGMLAGGFDRYAALAAATTV